LDPGRIRNAIGELPDGFRMVFTLYLLEGFDHAEISQILGISESTSKSQYLRAKKKLKEILKKNI
jgi:RNA polymerase sigma-70 factor (ECF subfamily)